MIYILKIIAYKLIIITIAYNNDNKIITDLLNLIFGFIVEINIISIDF